MVIKEGGKSACVQQNKILDPNWRGGTFYWLSWLLDFQTNRPTASHLIKKRALWFWRLDHWPFWNWFLEMWQHVQVGWPSFSVSYQTDLRRLCRKFVFRLRTRWLRLWHPVSCLTPLLVSVSWELYRKCQNQQGIKFRWFFIHKYWELING